MRIAWIGSAGEGGGVPGFGRDLLRGLLAKEVHLTVFTTDSPAAQLERLGHPPATKLEFEHVPLHWEWNRWYSRKHISIFFSGLMAKALAHRRLVKRLVIRHRQTPFDVILQFSQFELLTLGKHLNELPPVVLLPCVHAAGELKWHRAESAIARQSENWLVHSMVRRNLMYRAATQKRDIKKVAGQIGMSRRFNELVREDYGITIDRQAVVYQPAIHLDRGPGPLHRQRQPGDPVRMLFIGRIAVRKGIEQLVELSRRLLDLEGKVTLEVVGGSSFWSNYKGELAKLDQRIGKYIGILGHNAILQRLANSDLLLVPSAYEPGGIVVAEALSQGCLPVVSDEVGSAEPLSDRVCERFRACDADAFEAACRGAIKRVETEGPSLRPLLADEARNKFDLESQATALFDALQRVAANNND